MFKKDVGVKNFSNMKNTERRNLISNPDYTVPSVVKKSIFKNQLTKGTVYANEALKPIWFKLNDSDEMIPTVFTLWENPGLIPVIKTHEVVLDEYIVRGADLMLPGTVPPFSKDLVKGKIVGIVSKENDLVCMAVGVLTMNVQGMEKVYGTQGVVVRVLHTYGDKLYNLYDAEKLEIPTNEDLEPLVKVKEADVVEVKDEGDTLEAADPVDTKETLESTDTVDPVDTVQPVNIDDVAESLHKLSVEDVDHFFHRSLLYSLTQDKIDTPITSSNFMSNHIIKNLPIDSTIKKTSYKKTSKWLKTLEKKGYLKLKGKGDDLIITDVMKKEHNDELKNFVPYNIKKPTKQLNKNQSNKNQLQVTNWYKPQSRTLVFLNTMNSSMNDYYLQQDLKILLNKYIKQAELVSPKNPKLIVLDTVLSSVIKWKESTIGRDVIFQEFLSKNFSKFYQVTFLNGKTSDLHRGELPKLKIILETPMGNKQITKIRYPDFNILNINIKQFNNELKTKCSSSTTIHDTLLLADGTRNNKGYYEIMIQGSHEKLVIELLTKEYGVGVSWIEVENKLKNKRKK